jgi:type IV secretory pathway ATPase VirB11/archaellum biosynthesis ATPase
LSKIQDVIIERLMAYDEPPIENLSINNPLKENILTLFICIYSRTPLFICGKPGSSKTLSVNWILKAFSKTKPIENDMIDGLDPLK